MAGSRHRPGDDAGNRRPCGRLAVRSVEPAALALERIGGQGNPTARIVAIEAGPVDLDASNIQFTQTLEELFPVAATLTKRRQPGPDPTPEAALPQGG
jgi:hypothetical protein